MTMRSRSVIGESFFDESSQNKLSRKRLFGVGRLLVRVRHVVYFEQSKMEFPVD